MKKNKMMRAAAVLGVAALLTTSALSGTLAKYTTETSSTDNARVAVWGFDKDAVTTLDLFDSAYDESVKANDGDNLIAPGTTKTGTFSIINASATAPEVKYNFTVSVDGSSIANTIKNNKNIVWQLDNGKFGTWDQLMSSILSLSGTTTTYDSSKENVEPTTSATTTYEAGTIPTEFATGETHTITWKWIFDEKATNKEKDTANNDTNDTAMGNTAVTTDTEATIKITVTATQID